MRFTCSLIGEKADTQLKNSSLCRITGLLEIAALARIPVDSSGYPYLLPVVIFFISVSGIPPKLVFATGQNLDWFYIFLFLLIAVKHF